MPEFGLPLAAPGALNSRVIDETTGEVAWGEASGPVVWEYNGPDDGDADATNVFLGGVYENGHLVDVASGDGQWVTSESDLRQPGLGDDYAAARHGDNKAECYDLATGNQVWQYTQSGSQTPQVQTVAIASGGVAVGTWNNDVHLFDAASNAGELVEADAEWTFTTGGLSESRVNALAIDATHVYGGNAASDAYGHLIDRATGTEEWQFTGLDSRHDDAILTPSYVAIGTSYPRVRVVERATGSQVYETYWNDDGETLRDADDTHVLLTKKDDWSSNTTALVDIETGEDVWEANLRGPASLSAEHVAVGGGANPVTLLDRATGEVVWEWTDQPDISLAPILVQPGGGEDEIIGIGNTTYRLSPP